MNSKSTKRALLVSALSLVVCLAMLVGTTFAWFTDTATTGVNKIVSGNLKMKVEYSKDMTEWAPVDAEKPIFDENALYEPGYTQIIYVKVTNVGSLALRYDFDITQLSTAVGTNAQGEFFNLYNLLMFGSVETDSAFSSRDQAVAAVSENENTLGSRVSVASKAVLNSGESDTLALVLYMPTTVGNEANNVDETRTPSVDLGININATQATVESDSFDNGYDAKAFSRFSSISYFSGTHTVTESIMASGSPAVITVNGGATTINADIMATADSNEAVAVWASKIIFPANVTIEGGNFTQEKPGNDDHYDFIYASDGGKIIINGGTFKAATPKWTLNCKDGSGSTITVAGGKFYQFDPSNANAGSDEIIVADGYKVVQNGDWYEVVAE